MMGADYKPGTVAVATVRGVEGLRVWRLNSAAWVTAEILDGSKVHGDSEVSDVRPLVVLDAAPDKLRQFVAWIREDTAASPGAGWIELVCSQIEAQTKTPRIPEPGLWSVVEAKVNYTESTTRFYINAPNGWREATGDRFVQWRQLVDPVLIREGVES